MTIYLPSVEGEHNSFFEAIIQKIVSWYKMNHEIFPWRTPNHGWQEPYRVWVSEIMLQQTTVQSVIPYFNRFMTRFPDVHALSDAPIDDVLTYWQGLGYYRRAHHLHKAAQCIVQDHKGIFPQKYDDILGLPGVGDYTASAVSAIAYHQPFVPVDGNVCRVFARLWSMHLDAPILLKRIKNDVGCFDEYFQKSGYVTPSHPTTDNQFIPSFFAQGLMDLGRMICTPKNLKCSICPIKEHCIAFEKGIQHTLPLPKIKPVVPVRYAKSWVIVKDNCIFLQKNHKKGLLSGLWHVPMTDFQENAVFFDDIIFQGTSLGSITHVFSHFKLWMDVNMSEEAAAGFDAVSPGGIWVDFVDLKNYAMSTLMKKILKKACIL